MNAALQGALRVLRSAGVDLDVEDLLDVLWLSRRLPTEGSPLQAALAEALGADSRTGRRPGTRPRRAAGRGGDGRTPNPHSPLHSGAGTPDGRSPGQDTAPGGRAVRVPEHKALREELALGRALRPLKRTRNRPDGADLDEPATAAAWADTGMPTAVMRPLREPWLRCTLVVDDGVSMLIWRRHMLELTRLLARIGGIRQVRLLGVRGRGPGQVRLRRRPFEEEGLLLGPEAAADPTGQTLVLVLTDGAGSAWRDGRMRPVLDGWARCGPTAVVHTMPRWLWPGSGVSVTTVTARTGGPGAPNSAWRITGEHDRSAGAPVPVLELSPASLGDWAALLASSDGEGRLPLWTDVPAPTGGEGRRPVPSGGPRAEGPVDRFLAAATPGAHRLAAHLAAAAPLSVPVMRLVQSSGLGEGFADAATLAEVFLSGIMRRASPRAGAPSGAEQPRTPLYYRQFDFHPDVKELLLHTVPTVELLEVRQRVSIRLDQLVGRSPEFPAWLAGGGAVPLNGEPFAWAGESLLERVGGGGALQVSERPPAPEHPVPATGRQPEARPYFFLSYAHTLRTTPRAGDPNQWVAKFYDDVCETITELTDVPAGAPIGFMDEAMPAGESWTDRISKELATCRVFVPLYSPRYFNSSACGQEWHTFSRRPVYMRSREGTPTGAIVPVMWVAMSHYTMPRCAHDLQFNHEAFGADYAAEGLYALIKLTAYRPQYELAVHRIAQRIVEVAEETVSPVQRPVPFDEQPNAFAADAPEARTRLRLFVLAPTVAELPPGRDPRCYGTRRTDWTPYPSQTRRPLAEHAHDLLRDAGYRVGIHGFEERESGSPDLAAEPAVVLFDRRIPADSEPAQLRERLFADRPEGLEVIEVVGDDEPRTPGVRVPASTGTPFRTWTARSIEDFDRVLLRAAEAAVRSRQPGRGGPESGPVVRPVLGHPPRGPAAGH
ncbi:TIR-like protein FxsC [Kitasatospora sp. KL5]|uniref:TIR-like protein FxsC n=1 Tax=Kitasatospora sp. KL5 TaxID=3425125 RepID=UPI003D6F5265